MLPLEVGRLPSRAPRNNPIDLLLCSWVDVTLPPYCARAVGTSAQSPLRTISPTPVGNLNPCCGRCLSVPSSLTTAPHIQGRTAVLRCWPPGASATTPGIIKVSVLKSSAVTVAFVHHGNHVGMVDGVLDSGRAGWVHQTPFITAP